MVHEKHKKLRMESKIKLAWRAIEQLKNSYKAPWRKTPLITELVKQ